MSVQTTADEKISEAVKHIIEAINALQEVLVNRCWGHDDYKDDYKRNLLQTYHDLIECRHRL